MRAPPRSDRLEADAPWVRDAPTAGEVAERRRRRRQLALAVAIVAGTWAGVTGTAMLALILAAPRLWNRGLEPLPENALLRWLVSPSIEAPLTQSLLWLLGILTLVLAVMVALDARRVWRAYAAWAIVGGVLTTFALVANWSLAPEVGVLAFLVGGIWSIGVAYAIRATAAGPPSS